MVCKNCKYWEYKSYLKAEPSGAKKGVCYRFPKEEIKYIADWCGEFIKRKES